MYIKDKAAGAQQPLLSLDVTPLKLPPFSSCRLPIPLVMVWCYTLFVRAANAFSGYFRSSGKFHFSRNFWFCLKNLSLIHQQMKFTVPGRCELWLAHICGTKWSGLLLRATALLKLVWCMTNDHKWLAEPSAIWPCHLLLFMTSKWPVLASLFLVHMENGW